MTGVRELAMRRQRGAPAHEPVDPLVESVREARDLPPGPFASAGSGDAIAHHAEAMRLRRRQISHDIRHELGTIMMLASLVSSAPDAGPDSRRRAEQILGEARWLEQLHSVYEQTIAVGEQPDRSRRAQVVQLDDLTADVVSAMRLSTMTRVTDEVSPSWAYADRLAYWRALRNLLGNAVRAAGPQGHVHVRLSRDGCWAVAQLDDDGPGFGAGSTGTSSLGMGIVQELIAGWGGQLEIGSGVLGGACVKLKLLAAYPPDYLSGTSAEER
jgi:signal transduction histidine kinase